MDDLVGERKRRFKDSAYGAMAGILESLATPRRLEVFDLLAQRPWTVDDLAREVAAGVDEVGRDLAALAEIGLTEEGEGGFRLRGPGASDLLVGLHRLARTSPAIQSVLREFVPSSDAVSAREMGEVAERIASGRAVLLDVRPSREHQSGSVPGAISVPLDAIDAVTSKLPADAEVVTMCRGPFCCWAEVAASRLRARGVRARSLPASPYEMRPRTEP